MNDVDLNNLREAVQALAKKLEALTEDLQDESELEEPDLQKEPDLYATAWDKDGDRWFHFRQGEWVIIPSSRRCGLDVVHEVGTWAELNNEWGPMSMRKSSE